MTTYPLIRWQVGDVRVTKVVECVQKWPFAALLPGVTEELIADTEWLHPHFVHTDGRMLISFHTFIIESQGQTIMVDTCVGSDKDRVPKIFDHMASDFMPDLREAGFDTAGIDQVFCTHLHVDHVGWNTTLVDGTWQPTFPNARYLFHREEFDYWKNEPQDVGDVFGDSVRPIVDAGLAELVDSDHRLTGEVSLEPTIGHTPGHHSVRISSGGAEAVITGDMTHHPVQFARPDLASSADWRQDLSTATRIAAYERWGPDTLVIGTHFAGPTAGHLVADGDAWRLDVV